jgi:hypothetical protein
MMDGEMPGKRVEHRTRAHKTNRLEQITGILRAGSDVQRPKSFTSADKLCRSHDGLCSHLHSDVRQKQHVAANRRRARYR